MSPQNFRLADLGSPTPTVLTRLRTALREDGVFFLDPRPETPDGCFEDLLDQARSFFGLPDETKAAIDVARSANYRGYVGERVEYTRGVADLKESLELGREMATVPPESAPQWLALYGANQWPDQLALPAFQPTVQNFLDWMERIGAIVLRAVARSIDANADFGNELAWFARLIHYRDPAQFEPSATRLEAHTDSGMVTLTWEDSPGMEARTGDQWMRIGPPRGSLVVFCGELMEFWTRGYFRACLHRVANASMEAERLSFATFLLPDLRTRLAPLDVASNRFLTAADDLGIAAENPWLTEGRAETIEVGAKEWERGGAIFPIAAAPGD